MGWRRGYAPDCKAPNNPRENNRIPENRYQDKPGTSGEHDNRAISPLEPAQKENPGALAGATGTDGKSFWASFDHNMARSIAASQLVDAVMDCAPDDRLCFLQIIAEGLSPGAPVPNPYGLMAEAREWARIASAAENKAYALACFDALRPSDQASFLRHVGARAAA